MDFNNLPFYNVEKRDGDFMKRFLNILLAIIICVSFSGCGSVFGTQLSMDESEIYSEREIKSAMKKVQSHFLMNFEGCHMISLYYDEEYSEKRADEWADQYGADEAIVLLSDFYVYGENGSLARGETYRKWNWILVRNRGESWQLETWGYG